MNKSKKFSIILCSLAFVIFAFIICFLFIPHTVDLSFADTIVVRDKYENTSISISKEESEKTYSKIINLCSHHKKTVSDPFSIPSCPFEKYELEFKKGNKLVKVFPANDGCETMLMETENKIVYYYIGESQKKELDGLLSSIS